MYWILPLIAPILLHPLVEYTLSHHYSSFKDHPRKLYIQKNVVKGLALAVMSPLILQEAFNVLCRSIWNYHLLRQMTLAYGMIDGYSLVRFYNELSETTHIHHTIVSVFSLLNLFIVSDPWRQLMVFGGISTLTFPVNLYLGLRFLTDTNRLRRIATIIYVPAIFFNVWWQSWFVLLDPFYCMVVGLLLLDDCILLRHLLLRQ